MNHEEQTSESLSANVHALLERSTLPLEAGVSVSGDFDSEEQARELSMAVYGFLKLFGGFLNLAGLEGATVSDDYAGALAKVERGFETQHVLTATNDEFGAGFAMAVPVVRNDIAKTHIVIHSGLAKFLLDPKGEFYSEAVYTLVHEAAHAHDHLISGAAYPVGIMKMPFKDATLYNLAQGCWSEYIACCLSADWASQNYCKSYEDSLCSMLSTARKRGNEHIEQFQIHRVVMKTFNELVGVYGNLLTRTSYLVGQIHGSEGTVEEMAPVFHKLVNETEWFKPAFDDYEQKIRALHQTYGQWKGVEVFEPLMDLFEDLLYLGGTTIELKPTGDYHVEFTRR